MAEADEGAGGILADITRHLAGVFRHMLPGILVVGGCWLGYPDWFRRVDLSSWQQLIVLTGLTLAAGNTWFALNRYALHQLFDYIMWRRGHRGPARSSPSASYLDDLGQYTHKSMHVAESSARAQQHVAFRASIVLLLLTLGELSLILARFHADNSPLVGHGWKLVLAGLLICVVGLFQMAITRRIDYYVVEGITPPQGGSSSSSVSGAPPALTPAPIMATAPLPPAPEATPVAARDDR